MTILISRNLPELKDLLLDLESECRAVELEINNVENKITIKKERFRKL